jgi:predicted metal-dependent HD superfamily phosphohydrolase
MKWPNPGESSTEPEASWLVPQYRSWAVAFAMLGGDGLVAADAWRYLTEAYSEPHRRYHDLRHATAVARDSQDLARELGLSLRGRGAVVVAAWTHDVVYDARPGDDERASAEWTRKWLTRAKIADADVTRAEGLVLATIGHDAPDDDLLATALLDADLAVLGADEATYEEYVTGVRQEYSKYSDADWNAGRTAVLEHLLSKPTLYRSEIARTRWESKARENLTAELTRWRNTDPHHR